jgi:hypothetical protein
MDPLQPVTSSQQAPIVQLIPVQLTLASGSPPPPKHAAASSISHVSLVQQARHVMLAHVSPG